MTRKEYISDSKNNHSKYYRQYYSTKPVFIYLFNRLFRYFTKEQLVEAYKQDTCFNTIDIKLWDKLANTSINRDIQDMLRANGDSVSLVSMVCIYKQLAKDWINNELPFKV